MSPIGEPRIPTPDGRTLLEVLAELHESGFEKDMFITPDAQVRCGSCHHDAAPTDLVLHAIRRLEGVSDPADEAAVLALECKVCGMKGTAVARYGPEAEPQDAIILRAIEDQRYA